MCELEKIEANFMFDQWNPEHEYYTIIGAFCTTEENCHGIILSQLRKETNWSTIMQKIISNFGKIAESAM